MAVCNVLGGVFAAVASMNLRLPPAAGGRRVTRHQVQQCAAFARGPCQRTRVSARRGSSCRCFPSFWAHLRWEFWDSRTRARTQDTLARARHTRAQQSIPICALQLPVAATSQELPQGLLLTLSLALFEKGNGKSQSSGWIMVSLVYLKPSSSSPSVHCFSAEEMTQAHLTLDSPVLSHPHCEAV
jgi:hypothetical protein